jgi:hypothetical protein
VTQARANNEADQVLGIRVQEDTDAYTDLLHVLVGTNVKLLRSENPGTLVNLRTKGFGEDEFQVLLGMDPYDAGVTIKVRESSVRFRSLAEKRSDLNTALQLQAIDPISYRMENASNDTPLTASDNTMFREIRRAVNDLLMGRPWRSRPLGEYNNTALTLLRQAQFDRRARQNPQIEDMVIQAIMAQLQAGGQEQVLAQAPMQAAQAQPEQQQPEEETDQGPTSIEELLSQVSGGGGSPMASQPAA